ncbi:MAG: DUF1028 domain-containing protein [Anaerolineales bacterium]|nr:DUF1028 domain-containing protein [Anaerolineales bacterium]
MKRATRERLISTYSIVARDPDSGEIGIGVQTHQMGVGWMVPWLLPGIGAVATQSWVNISFGPMGLAMLKEGVTADRVVSGLIGGDDRPEVRQLAVVDPAGNAAAWTGKGCIPEAGHYIGDGYSVQANMMDRHSVIPAMQLAYEGSSGRLADRIMLALEAAEAEGGDIRGMQSASLTIIEGDPVKALEVNDWEKIYDLRVDEHPRPLEKLRRLVRLRNSQLISENGEKAIEDGDLDLGLGLFQEARELAPELEENGFWQAITLADKYGELGAAAAILSEVFRNDARQSQWMDLINRLERCGIIETEGLAEKLIAAVKF